MHQWWTSRCYFLTQISLLLLFFMWCDHYLRDKIAVDCEGKGFRRLPISIRESEEAIFIKDGNWIETDVWNWIEVEGEKGNSNHADGYRNVKWCNKIKFNYLLPPDEIIGQSLWNSRSWAQVLKWRRPFSRWVASGWELEQLQNLVQYHNYSLGWTWRDDEMMSTVTASLNHELQFTNDSMANR